MLAAQAQPAKSVLRAGDFAFLSNLLKQRSGLALSDDKEYLLESRLLPIARAHSLADLPALVDVLKGKPAPALIGEVVEAMTTNESLFFRDSKPFDYMKASLLKDLRSRAEMRKHLRVWSAACSTGQEPYSIALTLLEEPGGPKDWRYEILGTDLAQKVIDKAKSGIYTQFEAQRGLPIQMLVKYFASQPDTSWQLKDEVRKMVSFQPQNLLEDFSKHGKFDLIFCRYVLIYFDEATKSEIVRRMCKQLQPGGILIVGGTESLIDKTLPLKAIEGMRGVYQLV